MPIAVSLALAAGIVAMQGLPARFPDSMNNRSEALLAFPNKLRGRCNQGPPTKPLPPTQCILGRGDGNVEVLLVGDSHANHFTGFVDELAKAGNLRGYDITQPNTPFLPGVDRWVLRDGVEVHHLDFVPRNLRISQLLGERRLDVVVLAGAYTALYEDELLRSGELVGRQAFEAGMRAGIREALAAADRVVVITSVPALEVGLHDCGLRAERFDKPQDCSLAAAKHRVRSVGVSQFFYRLRNEFPAVVWVEPDRIICDSTRCQTEIDGIPLYRDVGHLNDIGSRMLARRWLEKYGNPLVPNTQQAAGPVPEKSPY